MISTISMRFYGKLRDKLILIFGETTMQTNNPQSEAAEVMKRNSWITGFTPQAELWNGRLAMLGFVSAIAIELFTHHGVLRFWGILSSGVVPVS